MKKNYITSMLSLAVLLSLGTMSCAQNPKVKTITIINGDTTITEKEFTEKEFTEKEFADRDRKMNVRIAEDGDSTEKIVKKVMINEGKEGDGFAYAYDVDDAGERDHDIERTETKIVIKGGGDVKRERTVVRKSMTDDGKEKESLSVNIIIKNTTATLEVETSSKEPLNVSILDENGKQVFYDTQKTGMKYSKDIPLGKKGTYFLNLIQNKKSTTEKIIIK
ncbi:MAG TPA: T9SS type A sorting domain-containing protein [Bacteroidia bacterium]